ncbi:nucleotidyltransferase domain-containing protein [Belliella sp. R4-6]|uniref:Nucleotidyltransferase domain-containing protein n=1 Tax=Belliella alkalica TaxID=1730871 RepID=A0ABS9V7K6_9BACT|nr:nucleotidyltransferase domain-containing protein [Belliella alkalica]MCH7412397.1 nucleotidyltransferase domain-containing protein [Belliella alkalica]
MKITKKNIEKIKKVFEGAPVDRAFIFGSYARGDADKNSDIDILVELNYNQHIGLGIIKLKNDLEEILKKPVDLLTSNSISKHLLPFIDSDKQMIYER